MRPGRTQTRKQQQQHTRSPKQQQQQVSARDSAIVRIAAKLAELSHGVRNANK